MAPYRRRSIVRAARLSKALVVASCLMALVPSGARAYTLKRADGGIPVRWWVGAVEVRVDPELRDSQPAGHVAAAVAIAVEAWRGLPGVPDVVQRGDTSRPAGFDAADPRPENGIYLVRDWAFAPELLAVTLTTYDTATGELIDTDILINGAHDFALLDECTPDLRAYDLAAVLTHEMGHVLGLGETDVDAAATMWPHIGRAETHQRTIEVDDEEGALAAYAGTAPSASTCGRLSVAPPIAPHSGAPAWVVTAGTCLLLAGVRRPGRVQRRR